jgi:hypothetical protein
MSQDSILRFMEEHGLERTRDTYLEILFFHEAPDEIDGETEAEIPAEFRKGGPEDWEEFE